MKVPAGIRVSGYGGLGCWEDSAAGEKLMKWSGTEEAESRQLGDALDSAVRRCQGFLPR